VTCIQDLQPTTIHGASTTPCEYAVARARSLGQRHFSIVVTGYWSGGANGVAHYCYKDTNKAYENGVRFPDATADTVNAWKAGLKVGGRRGRGSAGRGAGGPAGAAPGV
jgi:hypothetical protein